jgi:uncharacterized membrane protein
VVMWGRGIRRKRKTRTRRARSAAVPGARVWLARVWNNISYPGYGIVLAYIYVCVAQTRILKREIQV